MKEQLFKILVAINKKILPSIHQKDPMKLSNVDKAVLGFKYWSLTNYLKAKEKSA